MRISVLSRPLFDSFMGLIDLKQGVMLIIFFGLFNKVAGLYGLFGACFAGATIGQISFYLYSTASLAGFVWGLKAVAEENSSRVLLFSHLYILDHLVSTLYTLLFAIVWWVYIPHDGRRVSNSAAQAAMVALAKSRGDIAPAELDMDDDDRALAAAGVWSHEKTFAVAVLLACWCLKIYFSLVLYSLASHLRLNTYRALPLSAATGSATAAGGTPTPRSAVFSTPRPSRAPSRQALGRPTKDEGGEEVFSWEEEGGNEGKGENGLAAAGGSGSKRSSEGTR